MLIPDKGESLSQFKDETCYFFYKTSFQIQFLYWLRDTQESKIITTSKHLIGIFSHRGRKCLNKVIR